MRNLTSILGLPNNLGKLINFPHNCLNHFRKACLEDYTHTFVDHIIDIMEGREVPEDEKAGVYILPTNKKEKKRGGGTMCQD